MKIIVMVVMVVMGMVFGSGCGKIDFLPTGPSEAVATDNAKSGSAKTNDSDEGMPTLNLLLSSTARVGDEVVVEMAVSDATDLYAVAANIAFDRSCIEFVKAEEGEFLKHQNPTAFMSSIATSEPNLLVIGVSSLGKVNGISGSGVLSRIVFRAIKSCQTDLNFVGNTNLYNSVNYRDSKQKVSFISQSETIAIE